MSEKVLNLNSILELYGFSVPKDQSVKLVNHTATEHDFLTDFREEKIKKIETYQREQGKDIFKGCQYIIAFVPDGSSRAVFIGIYKLGECRPLKEPPPEFHEHLPEKPWKPGNIWYDMDRLDCMDDLRGRLVVEWGSTRAWHQWFQVDKPKRIIEIWPSTLSPAFPGFDKLSLTHPKLKEMVNHPDEYREWHKLLKQLGGVYLIVDAEGKQYVGSASGKDGFLGRWREYAKNGHGGNKELKEIKDFSQVKFSILYICSALISKKEIRSYEDLFKDKLGSKAYGLNRN
jgi:hypothetical protein